MSRTDKTRPWWVRKLDHEVKRPRMTQDDIHLEYYTYKWWLGEMKCGCPMCSGSYDRKRLTHKDRRVAKKALRNWEADEWTTTDHRRKMW